MVILAKRKVYFYVVHIVNANQEICNGEFARAIQYIMRELDSKQRTFECPCETHEKRCVLDGVRCDRENISMLFSVGRVNFFPPYRVFDINLNHTGAQPERRENAKESNEAEEEYVHVVAKIQENDIVIALEYNQSFSIKTFVTYFSNFVNRLYGYQSGQENAFILKYEILPNTDFMTLLEGFNRATSVEITVDSQIVGSQYLNFAERDNHIRREIKLITKAEYRNGINIQWIQNIARRCFEYSHRIKRVKVSGFDNENEPVTLNTDACIIKRTINIELDEATRVPCNHATIFRDMIDLLNGLEGM